MPSLGEISVRIVLDYRGITAQLKQFRKLLQTGLQQISKEISTSFKPLGATPKEFQKAFQNIAKTAARESRKTAAIVSKGGQKIGKSFEESAKPIYLGFPRAMDTMREQVSRSFISVIRDMLSFRTMITKIVHYITFTVGVQMVMGIVRGINQVSESTKEFQRAIVNAATISGYLGSAFEKVTAHLEKLAIQLSKETVFSAVDVAKAFYQIASAGYDVSKLTKRELIPILNYAAATQSSLEDATYAVLTALKAFRLDISETSRVVDVFTAAITKSFQNFDRLREGMKYVGATAGSLNLSIEETVAALSALVDRGLEGSQAGQRLNMILTRLLKPTDQAAETLEQLGLTADDVNPKYYSLVDILYKLKAAGFGAAEASAMFRARTAASAVVLVQSADDIARFSAMLERSQGITETVAEYQEQTLWGALTKVSNALQAASVMMGKSLIPAFEWGASTIKTKVVPVIESVASAIKYWQGTIFPTLKVLISLLIGYKAAMFAVSIMTKYVTGLQILQATAFTKNAQIAFQAALAQRLYAEAQRELALMTGQATAAQLSLNAAMLANPITLLLIAVGSLVSYMALFGRETKKAKDPLESLNSSMLDAIRFSEDWQNTIKDFAKTNYSDAFKKEGGAISAFLEKIGVKHKGTAELARRLWREMAKDPEAYADVIEEVSRRTGYSVEEIKDALSGKAKLPTSTWGKESYEQAREFSKEIKISQDAIKVLGDMFTTTLKDVSVSFAQISGEILAFKDSLKIVTDATDEFKQAESDLNKTLSESPDNLRAISEATEKYVNAQSKLNNASRKFLSSLKDLVQSIRELPGPYDEVIGIMEDMADAMHASFIAEKDLAAAAREEEEALSNLANSLAIYGAQSSEAHNAEYKLFAAMKQRMQLEDELASATKDYESAQRKLNFIMEHGIEVETEEGTKIVELTTVQKNLLDMTEKLIHLREQYIHAEAEYSELQAKQNAYQYLLQKGDRILAEKSKLLFEARKKLFDIEYKLYKLRVDEDQQLGDLFKKLAKEGFINEGIVDTYKDMMLAKGELLKLHPKLAAIYGRLNEEQKELLEHYIKTGDGLEKLTFLTDEEIDTVIAFRNAQLKFSSSTEDLRNTLSPLIGDLIDIGAVSSDVAKSYYDLIDNTGEMITHHLEMFNVNDKLSESIKGIIGVVARLARALQDEADETGSVADVYDELLDRLGLTKEFGSDYNEVIKTLNSLYGTSCRSLADFSNAQLLVAAALIKTAKNAGIYERGMTAAEIATRLHISSLDELSDTAEYAYEAEDSMYSISSKLKEAADTLNGTFSEMKSTIDELVDAYYRSNRDLLQFALTWDFADTLMKRFDGDFDELISTMRSQDLTFTIDMMTRWDSSDWETFISSLKGERKDKFIEAVAKMSGTSVDVVSKWDGDDWSDFISSLSSDKMKVLSSILTSEDLSFNIQALLEGMSIAEAVRTLPEDMKNKLKQKLSTLTDIPAINIDALLQGEADWAKGIKPEQIQKVKHFLDSLPEDERSLVIEPTVDTSKSRKKSLWDEISGLFSSIGASFKAGVGWVIDVIVNTVRGRGGHGGGGGRGGHGGGGGSENPPPPPPPPKETPPPPSKEPETIASFTADRCGYYWCITAHSSKGRTHTTLIPGHFTKDAIKKMLEVARKRIGEPWPWAFGGIAGLAMKAASFKRSAIVKGPVNALIGEAGPEAVIPLAGPYRKYGKRLLDTIIPRYFPDLKMQYGSIVERPLPEHITANREEFVIHGPIIIEHVANLEDFVSQLKFRARAAAPTT